MSSSLLRGQILHERTAAVAVRIMGCLCGRQREGEQEGVQAALQRMEATIDRVKARDGFYRQQLQSLDKSKKQERLLYFVHLKKNKGLYLTLLQVKLALEQGCISGEVVSTLRYSRHILERLTKKVNPDDIYQLMDALQEMSSELDESGTALAQLPVGELEEAELEEELEHYLNEPGQGEPLPLFPSVPHYTPPSIHTEHAEQPLLAEA